MYRDTSGFAVAPKVRLNLDRFRMDSTLSVPFQAGVPRAIMQGGIEIFTGNTECTNE